MIKLLGEKANKTEIDAIVREADGNGDGTVDFEGELVKSFHLQLCKLVCVDTELIKKTKPEPERCLLGVLVDLTTQHHPENLLHALNAGEEESCLGFFGLFFTTF